MTASQAQAPRKAVPAPSQREAEQQAAYLMKRYQGMAQPQAPEPATSLTWATSSYMPATVMNAATISGTTTGQR